jgi:hypothetical protein
MDHASELAINGLIWRRALTLSEMASRLRRVRRTLMDLDHAFAAETEEITLAPRAGRAQSPPTEERHDPCVRG